jgi:hypothetical protein
MRCSASVNADLGETAVLLASNCYTDSMPLLQRIIFRKQPICTTSQSFPLAAALLIASHCGEHFEFADMKIGSDYAEAIRLVLGENTNISTVNSHHRSLSTREHDIFSSKSEFGLAGGFRPDARSDAPMSKVNWSGDFVDSRLQSSRGHHVGMYFTNANYFTDSTTVSVALALIHGMDRLRIIYVPAPTRAASDWHLKIAEALQIVSISLEYVE